VLHRLVISIDEGEFLEFRITRGAFTNAEKLDPDDRFANRELSVPAGGETVKTTIENQGWWNDD
jgi:hypothetical protein